jgi:hypothetical protein
VERLVREQGPRLAELQQTIDYYQELVKTRDFAEHHHTLKIARSQLRDLIDMYRPPEYTPAPLRAFEPPAFPDGPESFGAWGNPTLPSQDDPRSYNLSSLTGGGMTSVGLGLSLIPDAPAYTPANIPGAAPGTNFPAAAAQGRRAYRAANVMPPGTNAQHWTKELSAAATNMDPAVMNQNMSPLQSRNALPATTLLVDPNGRGTRYTVLWGSTYGNEHKFADRYLIPEIEAQIRAANPNANPREVAIEAGRQARWIMTGEPGPSPIPQRTVPSRSGAGAALSFGNTAMVAGGALNIYAGTQQEDPALAALSVTGGSLQVAGGLSWAAGAWRSSAPLMNAGARLSVVGSLVTAPITAVDAYNDLTSGDDARQILGLVKGAGIVLPPAAILGAYTEVVAKPAAEHGARTFSGAIQQIYGIWGTPR